MTVLVTSGSNTLLPDMKDVYTKKKEEGGLFSSLLPLDYKNVAHLILGSESPCLPACITCKRLILINLFLAYHFVSR